MIVAEADDDRADEIAQILQDLGTNHIVECIDVCQTQAIRDLKRVITEKFGRLDILVNNVGDFLGLVKRFEDFSDDDFDALYTINLRQKLIVTREMLPLLADHADGSVSSVINLTSAEGFRGLPNGAAYSSFMASIHAFSRALAVELGPRGVRVNTLSVDTTATERVRPDLITKPEFADQVKHWFPLGRYGTVDDASSCVMFLASELSGWVTGQCLSMDGGSLAAGNHHRLPNGEWTNTPVLTENGLMPPPAGPPPD